MRPRATCGRLAADAPEARSRASPGGRDAGWSECRRHAAVPRPCDSLRRERGSSASSARIVARQRRVRTSALRARPAARCLWPVDGPTMAPDRGPAHAPLRQTRPRPVGALRGGRDRPAHLLDLRRTKGAGLHLVDLRLQKLVRHGQVADLLPHGAELTVPVCPRAGSSATPRPRPESRSASCSDRRRSRRVPAPPARDPRRASSLSTASCFLSPTCAASRRGGRVSASVMGALRPPAVALHSFVMAPPNLGPLSPNRMSQATVHRGTIAQQKRGRRGALLRLIAELSRREGPVRCRGLDAKDRPLAPQAPKGRSALWRFRRSDRNSRRSTRLCRTADLHEEACPSPPTRQRP